MKFFCLGDEDTVRGFRLAGVAGRTVETPAEAAEALAQAAAQPDCGVVILTERVAAGIRAQVDAVQLGQARALIVEIPGPEGPQPGRRGLGRILQEAAGLGLQPDGSQA